MYKYIYKYIFMFIYINKYIYIPIKCLSSLWPFDLTVG